MRNTELVDYIMNMLLNPRSLQDLCRLRLRHCLVQKSHGLGISGLLKQLNLPSKLQKYLSYDMPEDGVPFYNWCLEPDGDEEEEWND